VWADHEDREGVLIYFSDEAISRHGLRDDAEAT
jgi:hypothetical protein